MELKIFQVDAFTATRFRGNPAAVIPLTAWLPDATMQAIAAENNLAETAFFCREADLYRLRWFTPTVEVDLCGHATLAASFVLFTEMKHPETSVSFASRSGILTVTRKDDLLSMDFPSLRPEPVSPPRGLIDAMGLPPRQVLRSMDYMLVYDREEEIRRLEPDFVALGKLDGRGVIATARGKDVDFVSRFFGPAVGINEDPVTGSAHSQLTPYWCGILGKKSLHALQISSRGGELFCEERGERVTISGHAVVYLRGTIEIGDPAG